MISSHTIFCLFCSIFLINIYEVNSYCLNHQHTMLLHLKNNLIFNPATSSKLVLWNQTDKNCCQWKGVTCYKGHVTALDLSHESISGGLNDSSSLFGLRNLQQLNLAFNEFHSIVIPTQLHKLQNLRYLNLSSAGFEGQIPKEISYLRKLVTLDLSSSFASNHHRVLKLEKPNLAMLLQNLTDITELYLDGVAVSAKGDEWARGLSSLKRLRVLSMSSCNLSGPIDSLLADKLQSLSVINLSQNKLLSTVPNSIANLSNLTILQLSSCGLKGSFPKGVFQIQSLKVLDISENQNLHGSLPNFPPLASFQYLNLNHTNFSGQLPDSISNLKQLSFIDLSYCQFNGTLPSSISELTQLVYLDLSSNNFTGPLPSFNKSKNLTYLSLLLNHLSGVLPSSHFEGLKNLVSINLGFNSFLGNIPLSILKLPRLRELKLPYNQLNGDLSEFDNATFPVLEMLDLGHNNLQGPIPVSIFDLKSVRVIQLSSNKLNGTIQLDIIRRLSNLTILGLSHNKLSIDVDFKDDHDLSPFPDLRALQLDFCNLRGIPSFLRNQFNLISLDLSGNQIGGPLPEWIWKLESLISLNLSRNLMTHLEGSFWNSSSNIFTLDLSFNQLQGPISFIPKYASYLDYSSNRFSSIIPPDIGNYLPFIIFLYLSNNSFHGQIHESYCNASSLSLLDLSNNNFVGTIPKCFAALTSHIKMLNLGGNKLQGHISETMFPNSCALRFLDLSDNLLSGTIPKSLANCKFLQVLNLGKNALNDRFPCFLSNLSILRIMVLKSNKLHGSIECPNGIGGWEMLHIVDLSSNNFSGAIQGALLNNWKAMMRDENKAGTEFGHLFIDVVENYHSMSLKDVLGHMDKYLAEKLVKVIGNMSRSILDQGFADANSITVDLARYQDSLIIVNKGQQMNLVKIQKAFTYVDMSSNYLEGPIPNELMQFRALNALNLSHNALQGHIPTSIGNMKNLESLDLSKNSLNGEIPQELAILSFLEYLNLSFNHLVGRIPIGTQIQSFDAHSFEGNGRLCGPPLTKSCGNDGVSRLPPLAPPSDDDESSIEWNFLSVELGVIFGFGIFIIPLICWKKWRLWYSKHLDELLYRIIPQLDFVYEQHGGKRYRTLRWISY